MASTLVCVHGLAGSARWWRPVLSGHGHRFDVRLLDLRRVRPRAGAAWLEEQLRELERPVLVGHSLGGLLCAQLATRRADLARLVLVDPAGIPSGRPLPLEALALVATARTLRPQFVPTLALDTLRWGPRALLRGGLYAVETDLRVELRRISARTLVVWGERDSLVPARLAPAWRDAIPDARLAVIPRAGHIPMVENPSAFVRVLLDFLEEGEHRARDGARRGVVDGVRAVEDGELPAR